MAQDGAGLLRSARTTRACQTVRLVNSGRQRLTRTSRGAIALRIRTVATRNQPCAASPDKTGGGCDPAVIFDPDYWALMVR